MTAPASTNFAISGIEGVDITQTYSVAGSTPELPGPPFAVGTHALGSNGSEFLFVKASAALKQWQAVQVDNNFNASTATISSITQQRQVGWAQVAFTSGYYGWVQIRGDNVGALTKLGSLANAKLYVSGTSPGCLSSTSVRTSALITGIILTSSATSTAISGNISGPMTILGTWPRALL